MMEKDDNFSTESSDRTDCLPELAQTYADFVKVDLTKEKKIFEETADELLTKLEEFLSLVDLIRSDNTLCLTATLPRIHRRSVEMERIFQSIDKLEAFVSMVTRNVDDLDTRLTIAEKDLRPVNTLSKFLRPLFSRKETEPKGPEGTLPYTPPVIYKTTDYILHADSSTSEDEVAT